MKKRALDKLAAVICLVLFVCAAAEYAHDRRSRTQSAKFAREYAIDVRRPDFARSLPLAPTSDFAADLLADATLRDVLVPVDLNRVTPEARAAWIAAVPRYDAQTAGAIELVLDAVKTNPGWPYHQLLTGQLVFARDSQRLARELVTRYRQWELPMRLAASAAPNDDATWRSLAVAYLQTWPELSAKHAGSVQLVFRRAFADASFVRNAFVPTMNMLGTKSAVSFLPDSAAALRVAFESLAAAGEKEMSWRVHQRWDAAEWNARASDLARIEHDAQRSGAGEVYQLCAAWASSHSVWDYDSVQAEAQAARLLELWPDSGGQWPDDPRADIVRYLLVHEASKYGSALDRTVDQLDGVPPYVQAQVKVFVSDVATAERIARSSETFGTLQWKSYVLQLARYWLDQRQPAEARKVLAQLPPASREECDSIIVRAAAGDGPPATPRSALTRTASGRVDLPVCVDRSSPSSFEVSTDTEAIVDYGWDEVRSGTAYARPGQALIVQAHKRPAGAHIFFARTDPPSANSAIRLTGPRAVVTQ